jgi:hypothetical protein
VVEPTLEFFSVVILCIHVLQKETPTGAAPGAAASLKPVSFADLQNQKPVRAMPLVDAALFIACTVQEFGLAAARGPQLGLLHKRAESVAGAGAGSQV